MGRAWFVDASVILRAIINGSAAVENWFASAVGNGDSFYSSKMLDLEVRRVVRNNGADQSIADDYLERFYFAKVTPEIIEQAIQLPMPVGAADALYVVTARELNIIPFTFVTHDAQQARAAKAVGKFLVQDPVTDDPNRPPVT